MSTIDPKWLRRRYLSDDAPVAAIAAEAGVDVSTVHRALRAAGVPKRGKAGARPRHTLDREWLAARLGEGANPNAIATEAGLDRSTVLWQMAGYGLLDLNAEDRARAALAAEKYRRGQSLPEVAASVGRDRKRVTLYLRALGVPIRPQGRRSTEKGT